METRVIELNGERFETVARTLHELVNLTGNAERKVATALNGEFVPIRARASAILNVGDRVEIVAPRQGG